MGLRLGRCFLQLSVGREGGLIMSFFSARKANYSGVFTAINPVGEGRVNSICKN